MAIDPRSERPPASLTDRYLKEGMRKKIALGAWSVPMFSVLYALRPLRGTPLDPFGHTRVRRLERDEYVATMRGVCSRLADDTFDTAVDIAELPDLVRGYEHVKLDNVADYRRRLSTLQGELR
jgi:indolepyruvate ferredoxin oxidoreductase